jgi:tetratricopeptide (TPR) repeat protein
VINLSRATLMNADKPVLEETYYWRGMAKAALGDREGALEDLNRAFKLNPNSTPAEEELQRLGAP